MKKALLRLTVIAAVLAVAAGTALSDTLFVVSGWDTHNPYFSADLGIDAGEAPNGRVRVLLLAEIIPGYEVSGYSITESDTEPGEWGSTLPEQHQFSDPQTEGEITLYAWVKYSDPAEVEDDIITQVDDWIVYSTNVPNIEDIQITTAPTAPNTIKVEWSTEDDAGIGMSAIGWLEYREKDSGNFIRSAASETGYSSYHGRHMGRNSAR